MPYIKNKPLGQESPADVQAAIVEMIKDLSDIYKNKSSDEYKMMGDITKSPVYEKLETSIANLKTLKGFPDASVNDYQQLFNALHKPMYKKLVLEFTKKATEKNTTFTAIFTVGYRTLVGDMARIYASTEATENGIIYKPDKITQNPEYRRYIKDMCNNMEDEYNKVLRRRTSVGVKQELAILNTIGSGVTALASIINAHEIIPITSFLRDVFTGIFGAKKELNPISFINHRLTENYDAQVKKFEDAQKMYEATKQAYEEYKNSPGRKSMAVEGKYVRNIKKYNIMMQNLQAKIKHFDARAEAEAQEKLYKLQMEKKAQAKEQSGNNSDDKKPPKKGFPFGKPKPKPSGTSDTNNDKPEPSSSTNDDDFIF